MTDINISIVASGCNILLEKLALVNLVTQDYDFNIDTFFRLLVRKKLLTYL